MSCLHIVNKSPFSHAALTECLASIGESDVLLLIEDAVYGATAPQLQESFIKFSVSKNLFLLKADAEARAVAHIPNYFQVLDYEGFVNLAVTHENSVSWF